MGIDQNKPYISFTVGQDNNLEIKANNYPEINQKCSGLEATRPFEEQLGEQGDRTYLEESPAQLKQEQNLYQ